MQRVIMLLKQISVLYATASTMTSKLPQKFPNKYSKEKGGRIKLLCVFQDEGGGGRHGGKHGDWRFEERLGRLEYNAVGDGRKRPTPSHTGLCQLGAGGFQVPNRFAQFIVHGVLQRADEHSV